MNEPSTRQGDSPEVIAAREMIADAGRQIAAVAVTRDDPLMVDSKRRVCVRCGKIRRIQMFRRKSKRQWEGNRHLTIPGERAHSLCLICRREKYRGQRDNRKDGLRKSALQLAIRDLLKGQVSRQITIGDLSAAAIKAWGGVDAFMREWYLEIQKTRCTEGVNRHIVNECYKSISELVKSTTEHAPKVSLDTMSSDDITSLLEAQAVRLFASNPELFREQLRAAGYDMTKLIEAHPVDSSEINASNIEGAAAVESV